MRIKWLAIPVVVLIAGCSAPVVSTSIPASPPPTPSLIPSSPIALPIETKPAPSPLASAPAAAVEPPVTQAALCPGPVSGERIPLGRARSEEEIAALARECLADRLGTPIEQVEMISLEKEWWDDDTLGCPHSPGNYPDRAYPGPIPGYRIVLAAQGALYEYRSGGLWLIFCEVWQEG